MLLMKNRCEERFDERQIQLRGRITRHGFLVLLVLVLANGALQDMGIVWAKGFEASSVLIMLAVTEVLIESIWRGSYFDRNGIYVRFFRIFYVMGIVLSAFSVYGLFTEKAITDKNGLTSFGLELILTACYLAMTGVSLYKRHQMAKEGER